MISWWACSDSVSGLVEQRQPLVHAEAVLLVHHGQPQFAEMDALLHQCMGSNHQGRIFFDGLQGGLPGFTGDFAAEPDRVDPHRLQPFPETAQVLFGQQLSGRHDGNLEAVTHCPERSHGCNHGFARADIALDQPLHRVAP